MKNYKNLTDDVPNIQQQFKIPWADNIRVLQASDLLSKSERPIAEVVKDPGAESWNETTDAISGG